MLSQLGCKGLPNARSFRQKGCHHLAAPNTSDTRTGHRQSTGPGGGRTAPAPGHAAGEQLRRVVDFVTTWLKRGPPKNSKRRGQLAGNSTQRSAVVLFPGATPSPPTRIAQREMRYHRVAVRLYWLRHPIPAHIARATAYKEWAYFMVANGRVQGC